MSGFLTLVLRINFFRAFSSSTDISLNESDKSTLLKRLPLLSIPRKVYWTKSTFGVKKNFVVVLINRQSKCMSREIFQASLGKLPNDNQGQYKTLDIFLAKSLNPSDYSFFTSIIR
jgi:hypothetical protein